MFWICIISGLLNVLLAVLLIVMSINNRTIVNTLEHYEKYQVNHFEQQCYYMDTLKDIVCEKEDVIDNLNVLVEFMKETYLSDVGYEKL